MQAIHPILKNLQAALPARQARGGGTVTYETEMTIEIAGTRHSVPLEIDYRVATVDGRRQPVHDAVSVVCGEKRFRGDWVYDAMCSRQLRALDREMLTYWDSGGEGAAWPEAVRI